MATWMGILAGLGAAGASAYSASQAPSGGGGGTGNVRRVGTPWATGGQSYLARLMALNAATPAPNFGEFVRSGGQASFPMAGAGQFTPIEAERLGLVGANNEPVPWFDPTGQNRLTQEQVLFQGAQRLARRRQGQLEGPMTPAEQLSQLEYDINRTQRTLKGGKKKLKPKEVRGRLTRMQRNQQLRDQLRDRLFGAPYQPAPWAFDQTVALPIEEETRLPRPITLTEN